MIELHNSDVPIDNLPFEFENFMNFESNRIESMRNINTPVCVRQLACYGFYYLATEDHVKCNFCNVVIANWHCYDDPLIEHYIHSPHCPLLIDEVTLNKPLAKIDIPKILKNKLQGNGGRHPFYALYDNRLESFGEWPKVLNPKPKQLAEAGFFYLQVGDHVKCYYCGGALKNWEPTDSAIAEHLNHFKNTCNFIRKFDGSANLVTQDVVPDNPRKRKNANKMQIELLSSFDKNITDKKVLNDKWAEITTKLNSMGEPQKETSEWKRVRRHLMYNNKRKYLTDSMVDGIVTKLNRQQCFVDQLI